MFIHEVTAMRKSQDNIATIYDVAREAGVSPATVSRVLNHYPQVKRSTSERVITAMKKLDFHRNDAKSSSQLLSSSANRTLPPDLPRIFLLSILHTASSPYAGFIEGAQSAAQKNGHHLLINSTPVNEYNFDFFIATMKAHNIAGIISTETIAASDLLKINNCLPLVQCGEYNASVEQLSYVGIDDIHMAHYAAGLLKKTGADRLLYITVPANQQSMFRRSQGFQQFFAASGGSFHPDFIYALHSTDVSYATGQIASVLKRNMPDAVLTSNAQQAILVLRAAHMLEIDVPSKLQILSLEDSESLAYCSPPISAMGSLWYEIGFRAFELLLSEFRNPYTPKQHILLKSEYIQRNTTHVML